MLELNVIIVEDDPVLLTTLVRIIKREVRSVYPFGSAREALNALETLSADVVITDIKMEGMNGLEMIGRIRERDETLPVIVASAFSEPSYFQQAIRF